MVRDDTHLLSTPPLKLWVGRPFNRHVRPPKRQPVSQSVIIGFQVATSSMGSATEWECTFHLGDKVLLSNSYLRTWRSGEGGHISDSLMQALLLLADIEHYSGCQDENLVLKLKWHTIAVSRFFFFFYCFIASPSLFSFASLLIYKCYQSGSNNPVLLSCRFRLTN